MSDDPFAEQDADEAQRDPIDDPFAELSEGVDRSTTETTEGDDEPAPDPEEPADPTDAPEATETADPREPPAATGDTVDPFDELGPTTGAESAADLEDAFEQMDVSGPAAEDVWESLDEDTFDTGPAIGVDDANETIPSPGSTDTAEDGAEHVVNKRTHCQRCPYFSAPPDVACDHEGTAIVEAVSFGEFRVRNCPMVSEEDPTFDTDE